jgi:hypothetical protein
VEDPGSITGLSVYLVHTGGLGSSHFSHPVRSKNKMKSKYFDFFIAKRFKVYIIISTDFSNKSGKVITCQGAKSIGNVTINT